VAYLNEYPSVIQGDFDPAFLRLPDEILVTVMRDHQKYFAVEKRNGELAPHFLAVINVDKDSKGIIRAGHERVLRARFADAQFSGSRIRNVGSPTICRSSNASSTNRVSAVIATRSNAFAPSPAGSPSNGSTSACSTPTSRRPTAPLNLPSVT